MKKKDSSSSSLSLYSLKTTVHGSSLTLGLFRCPCDTPTDPWLRSRPPTRPYLSQGPISVQPRDVLATANLCYRRGLAVASGRDLLRTTGSNGRA